MKKIITFLLMLAMIFSLASCSMLPEDVQSKIDGVIDDVKDAVSGIFGNHTHEFVFVENKAPTCTKQGFDLYECECGETKEEPKGEPIGHDMQLHEEIDPKCAQYGSITYKCTRCTKKETETTKPIGHIWGDLVEASRLIKCTRDGCNGVKMCDSNGKYADVLTFTFGDEEKAALAAKHEELANLLATSPAYDPALHGYAEEGELAEAYAIAETLYEEYSDMIFSAQGQYSVAMTLYYCNHKDKALETQYNDMQTYYTDLVAKFYSLSQPWYDSMYRDYFFYGATEEEIKSFLADSQTYSDPEYMALKDRNDAIELEFNNIANPQGSNKVPELYAEMVENNNKIALLLGYETYLDYAYENVYDREYTYQDVAEFVEYIKKYIVPAYNMTYAKWENISGYTEADIEEYYNVVKYSFFENGKANDMINDYIDEMNMAFTSNPDKQISFSDHLNNLMADGNLFRGTYEGAYVTYIVDRGIPIAYFGDGYDSTTTIAHEFGHYMNEIYNNSEYNQSYDLLETHSQGQEMLFIYFVEGEIGAKAYELVETYQLLNTLSTIIAAVQIDCFEQAIYLNEYDGYNSEIIMADNKITADEYDLLYESLSIELGIQEQYRQNDYWRYGMTISSPCYYISYSVSAINSLQIYEKIHSQGFDAAKESYLKLFTYTDYDPELTAVEVLEYAGLLSYKNEETYKIIGDFLRTN